jgi:Notch-like protein
MIFFKVLIILLASAPISHGAKERVPTDTGLSVDPPVFGGPCATNSCLNDGRCVPIADTDSDYFCQCSIGFYGADCSMTDVGLTLALVNVGNETFPTAFEAVAQVDPICEANPCKNTGRCIPSTSADTGYICLCSMGWTGQNCEETEEGSTRHLRVVPSEEDESESRMLQSGNTQWACLKDGYAVDYVSIWWEHTSTAAQWACNNWFWISSCKGQCKASALKLTDSNWYCYGLDPMVYVGQAKIWWGHSKGDAGWACNAWNPICNIYGGCIAKNVWYFDSSNRYNSFIKCSGTGGACTVLSTDKYTISLNRFDADRTDQKVWGCGGAFQLKGSDVSGKLEKEPSAAIGLSFAQEDSFFGWEGCCSVAGEAMQSRGYLSDGWFCEKDFFSTGIWLKGKWWNKI